MQLEKKETWILKAGLAIKVLFINLCAENRFVFWYLAQHQASLCIYRARCIPNVRFVYTSNIDLN